MNIGRTINKMEEASRLGNFHNFTYKNERKNKRRLIIDTAFARCREDNGILNKKEETLEGYGSTEMRWWGSGCKNFEVDLTQPLQIDKDCDIYIEQLTLWGINPPKDNYHQMIYLNINEFNNETSTNNVLDRYYMLPNETQNTNFESCDMPCGGGFVFKSKKLNYLASSPAKRLSKLNLTIIGENNNAGNIKLDSVFTDAINGRCLLELIIIEKE